MKELYEEIERGIKGIDLPYGIHKTNDKYNMWHTLQ